jgi:LysM repeat protein
MKTKRIFGLIVLGLSTSFAEATTMYPNPIFPKKEVSSIVVKEGQTLYMISKSNQLTLRQLYQFNDFGPQADVLEPGTIVYLAHKKRKSTQKEFVIVDHSATLRQIANIEGIRLKSLMRMNQGSSPDEQLPKGEKVFLR